MIEKADLLTIADFEAAYTALTDDETRQKSYEKVISTEYKDNLKYFFIECYNKYDSNFPVSRYIIAVNQNDEITALSIETYKKNAVNKYADFKFKNEEILFKYYEYQPKNNKKKIIEDLVIDMPIGYIILIAPMSYRNLLSKNFPESGIKRNDGFFITVNKEGEINYKRINCELYFDGDEEIEIGLGTFVCTKRRILYSLSNKLTMETFYNDKENICISLTKNIDSSSGTNESTLFEIIERTEKIEVLPNIVIINENISEQAELDRVRMGKHSYYDEKDNLIGVESWVRNDLYGINKYRIHNFYTPNEKMIMSIKLKQDRTPFNKYAEIKTNNKFLNLINDLGNSKYWFYKNKVIFNYISNMENKKMSSYCSEGYYVFYPLAGLTDIIIKNREFPLLKEVSSYAVKYYSDGKNADKILKPKVLIQKLMYMGNDYIEAVGRKFYAMKIQISDYENTNIIWIDRSNKIGLKWLLLDKNGKKLILKSLLTELNF